jgi:protein FAM50
MITPTVDDDACNCQYISIDDIFAAKTDIALEKLKASTVGLASAADYKKKRQLIEQAEKREEEKREAAAAEQRAKREMVRKSKMSKLSFAVEEEEEIAPIKPRATTSVTSSSTSSSSTLSSSLSSSSSTNNTNTDTAATIVSVTTPATSSPSSGEKKTPKSNGNGNGSDDAAESDDAYYDKLAASSTAGAGTDGSKIAIATQGAPKKLKKDPTVDTHFLPDRERDAADQKLRDELASEWKKQQELIKSEMIEITYSYWDGHGHRRAIKVSKGTRIDQFLEKARRYGHTSYAIHII